MNESSISSASDWSMKRAGSTSTLALLWARASRASSGVQQMAARMLWCLLSVMAMPLPDPHMATPNEAFPDSMALAQGWA